MYIPPPCPSIFSNRSAVTNLSMGKRKKNRLGGCFSIFDMFERTWELFVIWILIPFVACDEERCALQEMMNAAAALYCFKLKNGYTMLFLHAGSSHSRKTITANQL